MFQSEMASCKGLLKRLQDGEDVICAEGYIFEFERRGYLKAGHFVPEVVIEHPHLVKNMHEEFVHSGSDVVQAFTYYGHREKLRVANREEEVEKLNIEALCLAREVADQTGTLMAGNICNTSVYLPGDPESEKECERLFKEQIEFAIKGKADFIIAETFVDLGEAIIALKSIKKYAPGMPCVVNISPTTSGKTFDDFDYPTSLRKLEELGADVVGLNCFRGPDTMIPMMKEIRKVCKGPLACLPVPYRTTVEQKTMFNLKDQRTGEPSFPVNLDSWLCSRNHIDDFTKEMKKIGVQFIGVCCGNRATYIRAMAEALGRTPPASKYSPDMSVHVSQIQGETHNHNTSVWKKAFLLE